MEIYNRATMLKPSIGIEEALGHLEPQRVRSNGSRAKTLREATGAAREVGSTARGEPPEQ